MPEDGAKRGGFSRAQGIVSTTWGNDLLGKHANDAAN